MVTRLDADGAPQRAAGFALLAQSNVTCIATGWRADAPGAPRAPAARLPAHWESKRGQCGIDLSFPSSYSVPYIPPIAIAPNGSKDFLRIKWDSLM